jgi:hypothetical protein
MRYSIGAALLSGLIFPGLGQLLLKYYKTGLVMLIVAFVCVATVVTEAMSKALKIASDLEQSGAILDQAAIASAVEQASQNYDTMLVNLGMLGLVLVWLASVIHAYWAGKARDARSGEQQPTAE